MSFNSPQRPQGGTPEARFMQWVWDYITGSGRLVDSPDIKIQQTSRGRKLIIPPAVASAPGLTVQLFQVQSDPFQIPGLLHQIDYVVAKKASFQGDGSLTTSGDAINVAKALIMRIAPGPLFVPHPPYIPTDAPYATDPGKDKYSLLYAVQNPAGGTGVNVGGVPLTWVEVSERQWAIIKNVCIEGTPALQNFVASNSYSP